MLHENNKAVVRRVFTEVINTGNLALADELIAEGFVRHAARPGEPQGLAGFKAGLGHVRGAFPDWTSTIEDLVAEGNKVAGRWAVSGTHQGPFMGIPPTGRRVMVREVGIFVVEGGKLAELWGVMDELALLQQLGVLPPMAPPS